MFGRDGWKGGWKMGQSYCIIQWATTITILHFSILGSSSLLQYQMSQFMQKAVRLIGRDIWSLARLMLLWSMIKCDSDFPWKWSFVVSLRDCIWLRLFRSPSKCFSTFQHLQPLEISRMTEDHRDYSLSVQLIDFSCNTSHVLVSSWMDNRVKTPAKSLQAWAFSLGKHLLPATSSPSPSHATSPSQILSQFPGHIEAVLWPPLPLLMMSWQKTQT